MARDSAGRDEVGRPGELRRTRLHRVYRSTVSHTRQSALVAWMAFTTTFGVTRAVTYSLHRAGAGGSGGVSLGGRHIHHYNFGIALLVVVGAIAVKGDHRHQGHPLVSGAYGAGAALIVDELALLLDLKDVYWAKDGRTSVDIAIGLVGVGGLYCLAMEFWHTAARELLAEHGSAQTETG